MLYHFFPPSTHLQAGGWDVKGAGKAADINQCLIAHCESNNFDSLSVLHI